MHEARFCSTALQGGSCARFCNPLPVELDGKRDEASTSPPLGSFHANPEAAKQLLATRAAATVPWLETVPATKGSKRPKTACFGCRGSIEAVDESPRGHHEEQQQKEDVPKEELSFEACNVRRSCRRVVIHGDTLTRSKPLFPPAAQGPGSSLRQFSARTQTLRAHMNAMQEHLRTDHLPVFGAVRITCPS